MKAHEGATGDYSNIYGMGVVAHTRWQWLCLQLCLGDASTHACTGYMAAHRHMHCGDRPAGIPVAYMHVYTEERSMLDIGLHQPPTGPSKAGPRVLQGALHEHQCNPGWGNPLDLASCPASYSARLKRQLNVASWGVALHTSLVLLDEVEFNWTSKDSGMM